MGAQKSNHIDLFRVRFTGELEISITRWAQQAGLSNPQHGIFFRRFSFKILQS